MQCIFPGIWRTGRLKYPERNNLIETARFFWAVIIVYFHLLHDNIMSSVSNGTYDMLRERCIYSHLIVDGFLILGGYFLYMNWKNMPGMTWSEFAKKKVIRLWPVLAAGLAVDSLFTGLRIYDSVFRLLFLQAVGISLSSKGITWYISPFFWVSLLLFAILKAEEEKKTYLIIAVAVYFGYVFNLNTLQGGLGRDLIQPVFHLGTMRTISGMGLGILTGAFLKEGTVWPSLKEYWRDGKIRSRIWCLLMSAGEIGCMVFLLAYFLDGRIAASNQFVVVIVFVLQMMIWEDGSGILSRLLKKYTLPGRLGRFSYAVYVMQQPAFRFLKRTFWKNSRFVNQHVFLTIALSVLFCIFLGIAVYYLVERPVSRKA